MVLPMDRGKGLVALGGKESNDLSAVSDSKSR